jgi:hypothetical protein
MKAGDRVDIYEDGAYTDSGVVLAIDRKASMAQVRPDEGEEDLRGVKNTPWFSLNELQPEGEEIDPPFDPSPSYGYDYGLID